MIGYTYSFGWNTGKGRQKGKTSFYNHRKENESKTMFWVFFGGEGKETGSRGEGVKKHKERFSLLSLLSTIRLNSFWPPPHRRSASGMVSQYFFVLFQLPNLKSYHKHILFLCSCPWIPSQRLRMKCVQQIFIGQWQFLAHFKIKIMVL